MPCCKTRDEHCPLLRVLFILNHVYRSLNTLNHAKNGPYMFDNIPIRCTLPMCDVYDPYYPYTQGFTLILIGVKMKRLSKVTASK